MGIYVKFTKTTHQIWSCHVTLASNFEIFYFLPNSVLNVRKSYQIWGKLAKKQKSYRQKTNWGLETPPAAVFIGLRELKRNRPIFQKSPKFRVVLFTMMRTVCFMRK